MKKSEQVAQSAAYLRREIPDAAPRVGLILGSGLGFLAGRLEDRRVVEYQKIPHFPPSTAPGHRGALVLGRWKDVPVCCMQGRMHYYEGYGMDTLTLPVYVMKALGCETLLVTNACGGVNPAYRVGDIMLIADHIKLTAESPLRGENDPALGVRFPDMTQAYDPALRRLARQVADSQGISLREGVYQYFAGPQYETPAEVRLAARLGADAVGMSTVPEVIAARHAGLRVLGFSLVCNAAAGLGDGPLSEQEVLDAAEAAKDRFSKLVLGVLERL